jgi:hypothetical protein
MKLFIFQEALHPRISLPHIREHPARMKSFVFVVVLFVAHCVVELPSSFEKNWFQSSIH